MSIGKTKREQVYQMFQGRCAYCGRDIKYKEMQVDHRKPKSQGGSNEIENLFPSCCSCNRIKANLTLKGFRKALERQADELLSILQLHSAVVYGLIIRNQNQFKFYFERK